MPAGFRIEGGVLVVTFSGGMTNPENRQARAKSAELCRRRGLHRVLVDIRGAVIQSSILDMYVLMASLADGFPPDMRYAVLFSPETYDPDRACFSEDVAAKRGLPLKMFTREDEAKEWLGRGRERRRVRRTPRTSPA